MRKVILLAGVVALAACSQAEAPESAVEEVVAATEAPTPGTYSVAESDGSSYTLVIGEGLTFTAMPAEGEPVSGTFELVDDMVCFTPEGSEEEPNCSSASAADEDGVIIVTSADGSTSTITPVVEETVEEAAAE